MHTNALQVKPLGWVLVAWALLPFGPVTASARSVPTITVVAINGRNGKPVKGIQYVWVYPSTRRGSPLGDCLPAPGTAAYPKCSGAETAKDGTARFDLRPPEPPFLSVDVGTPDAWDACSRGAPEMVFATKQVVKTGVVDQDTCDKSGKVRAKFKPRPGEIVIFVRKVHFWENW